MNKDMGVLATNKRQFTLIYNSETSLGKQTLGYVESAGDKIHSVDISKTKLGDTAWVSVADGLNKPLRELFAKDLPDLPDVNTSDFSTHDWLKLVQKNPSLLQKPIAINGDKYMQVETPSEILRFFDSESAGLEQRKSGETPQTRPDSDKEPFV